MENTSSLLGRDGSTVSIKPNERYVLRKDQRSLVAGAPRPQLETLLHPGQMLRPVRRRTACPRLAASHWTSWTRPRLRDPPGSETPPAPVDTGTTNMADEAVSKKHFLDESRDKTRVPSFSPADPLAAQRNQNLPIPVHQVEEEEEEEEAEEEEEEEVEEEEVKEEVKEEIKEEEKKEVKEEDSHHIYESIQDLNLDLEALIGGRASPDPAPPSTQVTHLSPPSTQVTHLSPPSTQVTHLSPPPKQVNTPESPPSTQVTHLSPPSTQVTHLSPPLHTGNTPEPPLHTGNTPEPPLHTGNTPESPLHTGNTPEPPSTQDPLRSMLTLCAEEVSGPAIPPDHTPLSTGSSPLSPASPISPQDDWQVHTDSDSGKQFYFHPPTRRTTWSSPHGPPPPPQARDMDWSVAPPLSPLSPASPQAPGTSCWTKPRADSTTQPSLRGHNVDPPGAQGPPRNPQRNPQRPQSPSPPPPPPPPGSQQEQDGAPPPLPEEDYPVDPQQDHSQLDLGVGSRLQELPPLPHGRNEVSEERATLQVRSWRHSVAEDTFAPSHRRNVSDFTEVSSRRNSPDSPQPSDRNLKRNLSDRIAGPHRPHCHLLEKAGIMNKTKVVDNGKKIRKNWSQSWTVLHGGILTFHRDPKSAPPGTASKTSQITPEYTVELRGASVGWATNKSSKNVLEVPVTIVTARLCRRGYSETLSLWLQRDSVPVVTGDSVTVVTTGLSHCGYHGTLSPWLQRDFVPVATGDSVTVLKTRQGCEFLMQYDTESIISDWLKAMQDTIRQLGVDHQSEDEDDAASDKEDKERRRTSNRGSGGDSEQRRVRTKLRRFLQRRPTLQSVKEKGYIRDNVFGCHLDTLSHRENCNTPKFLEKCIKAVERRGLDVDGIYRVSGNLAVIQRLRHKADHEDQLDLEDGQWEEIHVITGALKLFLRELPEPLLRVSYMKDLVRSLPLPNHDTMELLFKHLRRVVDHKESNRMSVQSVSIVFGPTLLRPQTESSNMTVHMVFQSQIVELMLNEFQTIFSQS
ncbi:Rho GTPase-activating protein 27 [Dissostichus eleginoides]|uniref:Rho GTPase-activating protein 27 n=1 Tax=Dissostichus eleginoides TaxID=100907 RepID=A0AAD9B1M3_DISEL|nr:Rho GTPase-activating protein 27 [Dissostichus eleginoides]